MNIYKKIIEESFIIIINFVCVCVCVCVASGSNEVVTPAWSPPMFTNIPSSLTESFLLRTSLVFVLPITSFFK